MKKWWGKMPFRLRGETRKAWNLLICKKGLANLSPLSKEESFFHRIKSILDFHEIRNREKGYNEWGTLKHDRPIESTYTFKLRSSLLDWIKETHGSWDATITFQYRMYRHKIVTVSGNFPFVRHDPSAGSGTKGMLMDLTVISIDGLAPVRSCRRQTFAWNKIIERSKMLALPEGKEL